MIAHRSPISGIAAYQDKYVLTAGYDNQIILWDAKSQEPISRAMHDHLANHCTFSPDGSYALTSSSDYTARLWNVPDLRLITIFAGHEDDVEMSVFHPNKPLIATASRDHRVRVYSLAGALSHTFVGHTADVISVEWVGATDELISSSDDGTVKRWSLYSRAMVSDLNLDGVETDTIVVLSDGRVLAGNDNGEIVVIDQNERCVIKAHDAGVKRLILDSCRGLLVSLSYDRTMRLWKIIDRIPEPMASSNLPAEVWPRSCAFQGDDYIVFSTFQSTYRRYDWRQSHWDNSVIAPTHGVNSVLPSNGRVWTVGDSGIIHVDKKVVARTGSLCNFLIKSGEFVLTGGQLGKIFDASTGREIYQHHSPINCAASFVRDAITHVVIGAYTGEGIVLRVDGNSVTYIKDLPLHQNAVKGIAFSDDLLFSVSADRSASWWCFSTGKRIAMIKDAHGKIANGCVGLGGGYFASVSRDLKLRIWSPDQGVNIVESPHSHSIKCVSASYDGRFIATGSYDGRIAIYNRDGRGGWCFNRRVTASGISSISYDADVDVFLASSYDGGIYRASVNDPSA